MKSSTLSVEKDKDCSLPITTLLGHLKPKLTMLQKLFLAICVVIVSSVHGQVLTFSAERFSFGNIDNVHEVSREINLSNTGNNVLIIDRVLVDCGCTAGKLKKRELKPNESSTVTIYFNPKELRGKQEKRVTVLSNDKTTMAKGITFTANVVPVWDIVPNRLIFKVDINQTSYKYQEKAFNIRNLGKEILTVEKIEISGDNLAIKMPDNLVIRPNNQLQVPVRVKGDFIPQYNLAAKIKISAKVGEELTHDRVRVSIRPLSKVKL